MVAVLGIWGVFGYKIISTLSPVQLEVIAPQSSISFKPITAMENETFFIEPVLRDPFLGTIKNKSEPTVKANVKTIPLEWPRIIYGGMVKKQNTNDQIFVLSINDNQYLLKKGQHVNDITLVKGNSKEIVVRYKNQPRTIALQ